MTAPSIVEIYPVDESVGVVLSDVIEITFDREIDPSTIQIIVEGPDTDRWSGPDQVRWDNTNTDADDDVLATPGYKGVVEGTITIEKVDSEGDSISGMDYTGGGAMWYSKVVFTPTRPFAANTEYIVRIVGDEDTGDTIISGVATRTVFDTVKGSNLGDGEVEFTGGYTGSVQDVYYVRIKETGNAEDGLLFHWWKGTSPLIVHEMWTRLSSQELSNGILIKFDGEFEIDDEFSVVVKAAEHMADTYTWSFTTGSGSIKSVPSTVIGSVPISGTVPGVESTSGTFRVVEVTPVDHATNLAPEDCTVIVVEFSDDIDANTVTDETVEVWSEPVNGMFSGNLIEYEGRLAKVLSIVGNILTIQIG